MPIITFSLIYLSGNRGNKQNRDFSVNKATDYQVIMENNIFEINISNTHIEDHNYAHL